MPPSSSDGPAHDAPPVRIDAANERVWCGARRVDLPPRDFAVLRHLVEHAGQLVTKERLLNAVWRDAVVSEAALTSCIRDLRRALGDSSRAPRYIQTVHRRGFRFIGPVSAAAPTAHDDMPALVGRDAELARLRAAYAAAATGRRRVVFVTGEPGIGKTTLVEAFLATVQGGRVGRGQCVDQFGAGEAYLPILEALGHLGREPGGAAVVAILRRHAPAWLAYLPGLLGDDELAEVERRAQSTTRERTLRELADALDALGNDVPFVLALEDLHWSDGATIELLTLLARRREPARLLVIGTYRPADLAAAGHPLQAAAQELRLHGLCDEIALDFLSEAAIGAYLAGRFPTASFPPALAAALARSTSGNPLFLSNVVDDLIARGSLREIDARWTLAVPAEAVHAAAPPTLWEMVERQLERLTADERAVLELASVAGVEFTTALATPDGVAPERVEAICDRLARQGRFVRAAGVSECSDGTVAARFRFIHALYQTVLYARVPVGRRAALHARVGRALERTHGARSVEIAGELAGHFEHGRDLGRALRYRRVAADAALRRHAYRETAEHARRGLDAAAVAAGPDEVAREELALCMLLGAALIAGGWAAPDVERTYARARALCARLGAAPERFPILIGLFGYYVTRAELGVAGDVARQMLAMARTTDDAAIAVGAHNAAGMVAFYAGDLAGALEHLERARAGYDPSRHSPIRSPAFWGGQDVGVTSMCHAAWALWMRGFPDRAAARLDEGLALARTLEHPVTLAFAGQFAAAFRQARGEVDAVRALDVSASPGDGDLGIAMLSTLSPVRHGWLLCAEGRGEDGVAAMRDGIAAFRAHGAGFGLPTYLALLAAAYGALGRPDDGLAVVGDAREVANRTGAHYWDADLLRLDAELTLARGAGAVATGAAEAQLAAAIDLARRQGARLLELRAATSLARILHARGEAARAAGLLAPLLGEFDEGFDTKDLRAAAEVLATVHRG